MAITQQERELMQQMAAQGASFDDVKAEIVKARATNPRWSAIGASQVVDPFAGQPVEGGLREMGQDVLQTGGAMFNTIKNRVGNMTDAARATSLSPSDWMSGAGQNPVESVAQVLSQAVLGGFDLAFDAAVGVGKTFLPEETERSIAAGTNEILSMAVDEPLVQELMTSYDQQSERTKRNLSIPLAALEILTMKGGSWLLRNRARDLRRSGVVDDIPATSFEVSPDGTVRRIDRLGAGAPETPPTGAVGTMEGAQQLVDEFVQRGTRAFEKGQTRLQELGQKRADIQAATPEVGTAISVNVPRQTIDLVTDVDAPTAAAMREMMDVAETGARGQNVMDVPARVVADQLDLLETQRRAVGQQLEDAINNLPDVTVDMRPAYSQVDALLASKGVSIADGNLNFTASGLSPQQRDLLQTAYTLMREAGDVVEARTVHAKDSLFSALNREAFKQGVTPILVEVQGIKENVLNIMRDVYRSPLDNISDGQIRQLNTEYAKYRNLVDQAENTIFKTARTTGVKVDPEEKAAILLRRMDSNALSTPEYRKAVSDMDTAARALGYAGANPIDLTYFANDIAPLYKSPTVSRPGGLAGTLQGALEGVMRAGAPDTKDQLKAIRAILDKIDPGKAAVVAAAAYMATNPETVQAFGEMIQDSPEFIDAFVENISDEKAVVALTMLAVAGVASRKLSTQTLNATIRQTEKKIDKLSGVKGNTRQVRDLQKTRKLLISVRDGQLEKSVEKIESIMKRLDDDGLGKSIAFKNAYKARDVLYREMAADSIPDYMKGNKQSGMAAFNEPLGKAKGATPPTTLLEEAKKYKSVEEFVKAQGTPVYHATSKDFTEFDINKSNTGHGSAKAIFVSETPEATKYYQRGNNSRVVQATISPDAKIFDYKTDKDIIEDFLKSVPEQPSADAVSRGFTESPRAIKRDVISSGSWGSIESKEFQEFLKKKGFDGFRVMDMTGHEAIGITNPTKIKTRTQLEDIWKKANKSTD